MFSVCHINVLIIITEILSFPADIGIDAKPNLTIWMEKGMCELETLDSILRSVLKEKAKNC